MDTKERTIVDRRQTDKLLDILHSIRRGTMSRYLYLEVSKAIDIVIGSDKCGIDDDDKAADAAFLAEADAENARNSYRS
jgi:hypothetical protein